MFLLWKYYASIGICNFDYSDGYLAGRFTETVKGHTTVGNSMCNMHAYYTLSRNKQNSVEKEHSIVQSMVADDI